MINRIEYVSLTELAAILQVTHCRINRWKNEGKIPLHINHKRKKLIPKGTIETIKENVGFIHKELYLDKKDFLSFFNISDETYRNWLNKGWINKVEYGGKVFIPKEDLEVIKKLSGYFDNSDGKFITNIELSNMLDVSLAQVNHWSSKGVIQRDKTYKGTYYYALTNLETIKKNIGFNEKYNETDYFLSSDVQKNIGINFNFSYNEGKINHIKHLGRTYIHKKEIENIIDLSKNDSLKLKKGNGLKPINSDYLTSKQVAERLSLNISYVSTLIKKGEFEGSIKNKGYWMIPVNSVIKYEKKQNFLSTKQVGERLFVTKEYVTKLIKNGKIKGAIKDKKCWMIPEGAITELEEELKNSVPILQAKKREDDYTVEEVSSLLNLSADSIRLKIRESLFPTAYRFNQRLYIPIADVTLYKQKQQELLSYIYTTNDAINELSDYINSYDKPNKLSETKERFLTFATVQLNKTRGNPSYVRYVKNKFQKIYTIICKLPRDIIKVETDLIDNILIHELTDEHNRRVFIQFYNYCFHVSNLIPPKNYVVSKNRDKNNGNEKEIYSPEIFHSYYTYVKEIEVHILPSIERPHYANMWAYTILHLTDAWRGSDIVYNTPQIDTSSIQVHSLEWFYKNRLTQEQCQKIINQLYIAFKPIRTSKTNSFVTFIVEPDLVEPLAYALVISELHRRKKDNPFLLSTFIIGTKVKIVSTSGSEKHLKFFDNRPELKVFKSLKFNNSTLTYLFYSITETDGEDADLALLLTQQVRSHERPETTAIYVQATNKDGSINRVSLNLFRRGHFGWLYNYIIMLATKEGNAFTLEERTKLIENFKEEISPLKLENWTKFLLHVKEKKNSVIAKLSNLDIDTLLELLFRIFKCEMPSKTENAQCLTFPNCEFPHLKSCYSCQNIIPKNYILIELDGELERVINALKSTRYEAVIKKESHFLMHLLLFLNEAITFYGEANVNSFVSIGSIRKQIQDIAHKISLD